MNALLVGWNIGLLCLLLTGVAILALLAGTAGNPTTDTEVVLIVAVAAVAGVLAGWRSARRVRQWFARQTPARAYLWLAVLGLITLLSLPVPFNFMVY